MNFFVKNNIPCEKTVFWNPDYRIQAKLYLIDQGRSCALQYTHRGVLGDNSSKSYFAYNLIFTHNVLSTALSDYDGSNVEDTNTNFYNQITKDPFERYPTGDRHLLCLN
jgi:hypothetical protein